MSIDAVIGSRSVFSNERPAYSIYPPALVRHILFRVRANDPGFFTTDQERQRSSEVRRCVENHLNAVRDAFGVTGNRVEIVSDTNQANTAELKFSAGRSILLEVGNAAASGYRLRVRADIYSELFSISYLIDQIDPHRAGAISQQLRRLPREDEAIDWLFDEVWRAPEFKAGALLRTWCVQHDNPQCTREVGELVADFRSVLIYPRDEWRIEEPSLEFGKIAISDETQIAPEILAFASEHQRLVRRVAGRHSEDAGSESVVCGMAGGQALYVAELGQWGAKAQRINPVRLLLVYAGHSHAQIGRLMRRLHVLGELRHAAVLDWDLSSVGRNDDLRTANQRLRELSNRIDEATLDSSMEEIRTILPDFARINMGTEGGLSYRIERSRSYADSYLRTIPHLRITRIAGWQPYDDFVNRYIYLLFGRIDQIGILYEKLGQRLDRLMYYEQAKSLDEYQRNVRTALGQLHGSLESLNSVITSLHETSEKQRKTAEHQENLLINAEYFATVFLIYYLGSIYKNSIEDPDFILKGWGLNHNLWFLLAAIISIPLLLTLLFRLIWRVAKGGFRFSHWAIARLRGNSET